MGRYHRTKPARLAEKLLRIRSALSLSQNGMIRHLGLEDEITQSRISGYELSTREPSLPILLRYARAAGVCVDVLIDDALDLPARLPGVPKHRGPR
ncbi:MAG: Helix-turn-helix domain [Blastocatellia bacterium]|jgi:transcriptional regulator with XRE-family HTH domain|nr:Helix-turn-helix domain [Blastocatellia bacterium]